MIKDEIKKIIEKAIKDFTGSPALRESALREFSVEIPGDKSHGDYSTNIALILSKKLGKNPREVAEEIKNKIGKNNLFYKIEVAGPGFINFFISDKYFIDTLKNIDKNYGKAEGSERGRKIIIDYTDPNILKEFHIGHLMSNSVGESLSRIFEFEAATVSRMLGWAWQKPFGEK